MQTTTHDILIIGAGPAGLATAGRLRELDLDFEIIEQADQVGAAWHNHYDRLCLHTVKDLSHLPYLPFPERYPTYVPKNALLDYFETYAEKFHIQPHFGTTATALVPVEEGWEVKVQDGGTWKAQTIVIASGLNRVPYWPTWPGMDSFQGDMSHSRTYRNPSSFVGKRVLVVGMGNTGAEIALDLSDMKVDTTLSVRGEVNIVPRDVMGRPVQVTGKMLEKLPFGLGDQIGSLVRQVVIGNMRKYGLKTSKMTPAEQLRKTGKTPVIDLGTVAQIKQGHIQVRPGIKRFDQQLVCFTDGRKEPYDHVLMCTGYRAALEEWLPDTEGLLDANGYPQTAIGTGKFDGLYFVGFDNYKLGGILGTIMTDSETVAKHLRERFPLTTQQVKQESD